MTLRRKTQAGAPSPMMSILWFSTGFAVVAALFTGFVFDYWPLGFVLLIVGSSLIALTGYSAGTFRMQASADRIIHTTVFFNIVVCLIALLGLAAMYYDRAFLRGIDYSTLGMAGARAELTRVGDRGGIISVLGNLFSTAIYLPTINLVFDWERWGRSRYAVLAFVIMGVIGLTYITGGRTALLIAVAVAAAAMLGRGALGMRRLPSFLSPVSLTVSVVVLVGLFGTVFAVRASTFGVSSGAVYLSQMCFHLSQPSLEIAVRCSTIAQSTDFQVLDDVVNYGISVLLYAFHVAWVGQSVFGAVNPGALTSFEGPQALFLGRFGLELVATDYAGYFIPAAASLVYDFGFLEMALGFAILGLITGFFHAKMVMGRFFFGRVAFCFACAGLIISVMISPVNLPIFLLAGLSIMSVVAATTFARLIGLIPSSSVLREFRRKPGYRSKMPK